MLSLDFLPSQQRKQRKSPETRSCLRSLLRCFLFSQTDKRVMMDFLGCREARDDDPLIISLNIQNSFSNCDNSWGCPSPPQSGVLLLCNKNNKIFLPPAWMLAGISIQNSKKRKCRLPLLLLLTFPGCGTLKDVRSTYFLVSEAVRSSSSLSASLMDAGKKGINWAS